MTLRDAINRFRVVREEYDFRDAPMSHDFQFRHERDAKVFARWAKRRLDVKEIKFSKNRMGKWFIHGKEYVPTIVTVKFNSGWSHDDEVPMAYEFLRSSSGLRLSWADPGLP